MIWISVICICIAIPLSTYPSVHQDSDPNSNSIMDAIIFSLKYILWSMSISWILYNCALNRAGILVKIFSANILKPFSRLSFCSYLSHLMLIWFNIYQVRYPIHTNIVTIVSLNKIFFTEIK